MSNIVVIGIDHGWSMVKTASHVFPTSVKQIANTVMLRRGHLMLIHGPLWRISRDLFRR